MKLSTAILCAVALLALTTTALFAQTINGTSYPFSISTGTTLEDMTGATVAIGPSIDDTPSALLDFGSGFQFWYAGNAYTSFSMTPDGFVRFGTAASAQFSNDLNSTTNIPLIAPLWDDWATGTDGNVTYKLVGSAPNRKFVLQWFVTIPRNTSGAANGTFQLWLHETTGMIEFVYGTGVAPNGTSGYSSGLSGLTSLANRIAAISDSAIITNSTVAYVNSGANNANNITPIPSGSRFTFTPFSGTPAPPTGLTFSAVTQTGMTVEWTDNSTNETYFVVSRSTDGVTFTPAATVFSTTPAGTGTTYSNVQAGLLPGTTYHFRITANNEASLPSTFISGSQATNAAGAVTSNGTGGGNWSNPATWSPAAVPTASDNVTILNGDVVTLDATGLVCNNLTVGGGTSGTLQYQATPLAGLTVNGNLTIAAGATLTAGAGSLTTHTLGIGGANTTVSTGSLFNNGTVDLFTTGGVTTTFFGSLDGSISGSGSTPDFYAIVVNKGATRDAILDVTVPITTASPTASGTRLTITNGTFKLSSASTLTPWFGSQTICAANGRLWLNNASASMTAVGVGTTTGAGSPTVTGELRIDAGTWAYGSGNNTLTFSSGSGTLRMSAGTLNMFGAVSFLSNAGTQFIMSGGEINVNPRAGNNLVSSTTLFSIGASTTVDWSGGMVTIVNPHAARTSLSPVAWSAAAGGSKTITGGILRLGDGVSGGAVTGPPARAGFGITSGMPVYNLVVDNRIDSSATRQVRLTGTVNVQNTLTINANGYLGLADSATSVQLNALGNVVNNGTLAGTYPGGTTYLGTLLFFGTGPQTLSGNGTFVNIATVGVANSGTLADRGDFEIIENSDELSNGLQLNEGVQEATLSVVRKEVSPASSLSTVTLANTSPFVVNRVNMFYGALNTGANFTIGRSVSQPIIQIGGGGATFSAGSFTAVPTFDNTVAPSTYLYSTALGGLTTGAYNEMPAGPQTITQLLINDADGLTLDRAITVNSFLTFTLGSIFTTPSNLLVIGSSFAAPPNGTATSFVDGPMAIQVNSATDVSRTFAIGKGTNWRPLVLGTFNSGGALQTYTAQVIDGPTGGTFNPPLQVLNPTRYFRLQNTANIQSTDTATIQLSYGVDDTIGATPSARVAQAGTSNGAYTSRGGATAATPTTGIVSLLPINAGDEYFVIGNEASLPNCAVNVSPAPGATLVIPSATLNWADGGGATGYKIYFGTDNPPTNIENGTDLGNVLTYNPTPDMAFNTTYYWRIVAYNSVGDAVSCATWSFTTGGDPTVTTFPYLTDFEDLTGGGYGWTTGIVGGSVNNWVRGTPAKTQLSAAHSGVKAYVTKVTGSYDIDHNAALFSPRFNFSTFTESPVLTFWHNFLTETGWDGGVVEFSTDSGTTWRRVDSTLGTGGTFNTTNSTGWYNNSSTNGPLPPPKYSATSTAYTGHTGGWIYSTTVLVGLQGLPDVRLRWRFVTDNSVVNEGWAVDDVSVYQPVPGLAGNYTVGVSGNFPTLSRAIFVLDSIGVTAPVNFLLTDASYTDTALIILPYPGQGTANLVTFKPATGVTPTITIAGGTITSVAVRMDSVSGIVWDGSNSGGTDRSMTIESDTNTTVARTPFFIRRGSRNVTLKNMVIKGNRHSAGGIPSVVVIDNTGFAASGGQHNITVNNCQLMRGNNGIFQNAASGAVRDSNHTFTNNLIGGGSSASLFDHLAAQGITMTGNHNVLVDNNDINGIKVAGSPIGIAVRGANTAVTVTRNRVHNLVTTSGAFRPIGFLSGNIIGTGPAVRTEAYVANNMFYDLHNFGTGGAGRAGQGVTMNPSGPPNSANGNGSKVEFYYNTWHFDYAAGEGTGNTVFIYDANFAGSNTTVGHVDSITFINNIASSYRADSLASRMWLIIGPSGFPGSRVIRSDYNLYNYNTGPFAQIPTPWPDGSTAFFCTNLQQFRDTTGLDLNSRFGSPQFVSSTNAHIRTDIPTLVESGATPIAGITTDIDGDTRNATTPDIGADEGTFISAIVHDIGVASLGAATESDAPAGTPVFSRLGRQVVAQDNTSQPEVPMTDQETASFADADQQGSSKGLEVIPDLREADASAANVVSMAYSVATNTLASKATDIKAEADNVETTDDVTAAKITVSPVISPTGVFGANAPLDFHALVQNFGAFVENTYQVGWSIDGIAQAPVNNTQPLQIGATDTLTLTWASPTTGSHTARAWTILGSDTNPSNDTATYLFEVLPSGQILAEGFNGTIPPYPTGWHVKNLDGGGTTAPWFQGNPAVFPAYEGAGYIAANYQGANGFFIDQWLVTPNTGGVFDNVTVDSLTFWQRSPNESIWPDSIQIRVSTTDTAAASFTTVLDFFETDTIGWRRRAYALPNAATRYVAFRYLHYNGGPSGDNSNYVGLDDVRITRHTISGPGFFDDFEAYTAGVQLVVQNPTDWKTWSGPAGTAEDPFISNAQAFSGTKSVVIVQNNDLVKTHGSLTTGTHVMTFKFYIPSGKAGYFNTLAGFTPNPFNWGLEAYFDSAASGNNGRLFAGSATAVPFSYAHNTWQTVRVVVNLGIDSARFILNGNEIRKWRWTAGASGGGSPLRLDGNDFFGATAWDQMYMDDYAFDPDTLWVGVNEELAQIPETFALDQNYPNPFNPTTTIRFALPREAAVSVRIYNILGQEVATLMDGDQQAGYFNVVWDGRNQYGAQVASGVYLYRIDARPSDGSTPFTSTKKMLLLK